MEAALSLNGAGSGALAAVTFQVAPVISVTDWRPARSEEHTSELQSRLHLVCRLLLEKKKERCIRRYGVDLRPNDSGPGAVDGRGLVDHAAHVRERVEGHTRGSAHRTAVNTDSHG